MPKSSSTSEESDLNFCGICRANVKDGEKAIECDMCNNWVHNSCCSMPDDLYKILVKYGNKNTGTKWFCRSCEIHFGKIRMELKSISERQVLVETKLDATDKNLLDVKKEVSEMKREFDEFVKDRKLNAENTSVLVNDKIDEIKIEVSEIKKTYSGAVRGNMVASGDASNSSLHPARTIKVEVSEVMEREKRKNNLVIFGIDETNDERITKEKVNSIVQAMGQDETKIKYFGRVGRYTSGARARIVRVICDDAETKRNFLKAANKLKTIEGYENIYVSADLTKIQQRQDKALRDKLKEIKLQCRDAKINNGEIVTFENGDRKVLFSLQD